MKSESSLGIVLTLVGISGLTFAAAGMLTNFITRGIFAGTTLICCLLFFAGLTLLRDQLTP